MSLKKNLAWVKLSRPIKLDVAWGFQPEQQRVVDYGFIGSQTPKLQAKNWSTVR